MGMVAESRLAERLGIAPQGLSSEIAGALGGLGLPVQIPRRLPREALAQAMHADKKQAAGAIRFALPIRIGCVQVNVAVKDPAAALVEDWQ